MNRKIRVLHLIDFLGPGGAQKIVQQTVLQSDPDIEHHVTALTGQRPYYETSIRSSGANITFLCYAWTIGLLLLFPFLCLKFRRLVREQKPDILHLHMPGSMMVGTLGSLGLKTRRMLNVYAWPAQLPPWVYPAMRFLTPCFDRIQFLDRRAMPWVPESKFIQAYAGVDLATDFSGGPAVRKEFAVSEEAPVLYSVGRLHSDKGHDTAIRILAEVRKELPLARLFVIGEGPERPRLERLAMETGMADAVTFAGYRTDLPSFFGMGGFYLRTALNESGNMTNILAQYAGLVSVGFDTGKALDTEHDFIENGVTGCLVPAKDAAAMARTVVAIWKNRAEYARIGQASAVFVRENRGIKKTMVDPFVSTYRQLASL